MGMFDEVIADFKCPYCGVKVPKDTWQTKATAKLLDVYKVNDKLKIDDFSIEKGWMEVHHVCQKCKKYVQAEIEVKNNKLGEKVRYITEEDSIKEDVEWGLSKK